MSHSTFVCLREWALSDSFLAMGSNMTADSNTIGFESGQGWNVVIDSNVAAGPNMAIDSNMTTDSNTAVDSNTIHKLDLDLSSSESGCYHVFRRFAANGVWIRGLGTDQIIRSSAWGNGGRGTRQFF